MTRLPEVPANVRLLPDARLYQVWKAGRSMELEASFSALESAVEHIGWMLRHDPMQRVQLDILPPVEVKVPCPVCGDDILVSLKAVPDLQSGATVIHHALNAHWITSDVTHAQQKRPDIVGA